jgi:hypothetical protein
LNEWAVLNISPPAGRQRPSSFAFSKKKALLRGVCLDSIIKIRAHFHAALAAQKPRFSGLRAFALRTRRPLRERRVLLRNPYNRLRGASADALALVKNTGTTNTPAFRKFTSGNYRRTAAAACESALKIIG